MHVCIFNIQSQKYTLQVESPPQVYFEKNVSIQKVYFKYTSNF